VTGIKKATESGACPKFLPYFAASIALPDLKIRAEAHRRDSRSYNMPSFDEPLDAVKIMFHLDDSSAAGRDATLVGQSVIYKILDSWRLLVRAGRGAVGGEESIDLNADYKIDCAFPVYLYLFRGWGLPKASVKRSQVPSSQAKAGSDFQLMSPQEKVAPVQRTEVLASGWQLLKTHMEDGLYISGLLKLEWAWLSAFRLSELTYEGSRVAGLEATLYCENILQSE
jgi:hypothetical protein